MEDYLKKKEDNLTKMEDDLEKNKMEDDLKKNGRRPHKNEKMEDNHKYK